VVGGFWGGSGGGALGVGGRAGLFFFFFGGFWVAVTGCVGGGWGGSGLWGVFCGLGGGGAGVVFWWGGWGGGGGCGGGGGGWVVGWCGFGGGVWGGGGKKSKNTKSVLAAFAPLFVALPARPYFIVGEMQVWTSGCVLIIPSPPPALPLGDVEALFFASLFLVGFFFFPKVFPSVYGFQLPEG